MFANIFLAGLIATTVAAAPFNAVRQEWAHGAPSGVNPATETFAAGPASATSVFSFPLSNGFPNIPNPSTQLTQIEDQGHGTIPNQPPPSSVKSDTITSLQLIAFNEISEVAFFTELLENVTNNAPGYTFPDSGVRQFIKTHSLPFKLRKKSTRSTLTLPSPTTTSHQSTHASITSRFRPSRLLSLWHQPSRMLSSARLRTSRLI